MNRLQLFRLLRKNNQLSYRRSPAFEQSLVAKVLMMIGSGFFVFYLILYGTLFAHIATQDDQPGVIFCLMPIMMLIDFGLRFMVQQTPSMLVKPYLMLPLPRNSIIECFLLSSVFSIYNLLWLAFFLPYAFVVGMGGNGWLLALTLLISGEVMMMVNSQFYLMVRTLIHRTLLWWILPIFVYGSFFALLLLSDSYKQVDHLVDGVIAYGNSYWNLPVSMLLLAGLFLFNRKMQFAFVYEEISNNDISSTKPVRMHSFSLLERFGELGEYMKLEVKSIERNKAVRSRFIMSASLIVVFSALIAYTPIYDGLMMRNFWCYYCFSIYGMTTLVKVMSFEGNYIDLLMVQRENILTLLKAKYYTQCIMLILPFLVMLPAVIEGKFTLLMMLAYMLLSSGMLYFMLFQLAVYNKQTLPLNQKVTGKGSMENGLQLIIELVGMFLPLCFMSLLLLFMNEDAAYLVVIVIGLIFTLTHPLWLRNIYHRMMKRKYENLEGFVSSR